MTENKRFTDNGIEEIENQSFTDNLTEKTYWIDNGLDDIIELLNNIHEENKQLKQFKEIVFVLLDEKIKHYEHKPFSAPVSNPANPNYNHDVDRLARLSELQELKRELKEND